MERANHGGVRKVHGKTWAGLWRNRFGEGKGKKRREKPSNPRTTMGNQGMEDTASTKTPRGLDGHPTRGASGLARTQRKAAGGRLQSQILKSLYTWFSTPCEIHTDASHQGEQFKKIHLSLYAHKKRWTGEEPIKVVPEKRKENPGEVKWVAVGQGSREMERMIVAGDIFKKWIGLLWQIKMIKFGSLERIKLGSWEGQLNWYKREIQFLVTIGQPSRNIQHAAGRVSLGTRPRIKSRESLTQRMKEGWTHFWGDKGIGRPAFEGPQPHQHRIRQRSSYMPDGLHGNQKRNFYLDGQ